MSRTVKVYDLAHSRSGDKGNISNIVVVAYDDDGWEILSRLLTSERVKQAYSSVAEGPVIRYELPKLRALNFVIHNALAGGVTRSLRLDPHGKSLSSIVLSIVLPLES
ncbi:hypothetical protein EV681_3325 [Advenella incenata]|uniref:AtuA-like ferredoxin-fold domain-containing protein n=1 Tax=Advenella incenata TaxID=267800 RepID=A0A4Q7VFW7_9BURK|nr:hypothetical protein [Advenella incenata]RZT94890.1 hypothetical protein EV681_3325 [Advenella incenata]